MEHIYEWSKRKINRTDMRLKRYLFDRINRTDRLIILLGARGTGKTTLQLQYLKEDASSNSVYVSLDDLYFSNHSLVSFAEDFAKRDGTHLYIDEVHKYANWSQEVKTIYDNFPELKMIVTGSSMTEIYKGQGDLSRRGLIYHLNGLSFREYLFLHHNVVVESYTLTDILTNHEKITADICSKIKPLKYFNDYLKTGYYPFYKEVESGYAQRIRQIINMLLETDIPSVFNVEYTAVVNIKKLLAVICELVPFKPNVMKLSEQLHLSRETTVRYLQYLDKADVIKLLYSEGRGDNVMQKPDKIYLQNPNLLYSLAGDRPDIGNVRETFFINQMSVNHSVNYTKQGDFLIDKTFTFEIGGQHKNNAQIYDVKNAFIAADTIEYGFGNKIPLWLFGLMY